MGFCAKVILFLLPAMGLVESVDHMGGFAGQGEFLWGAGHDVEVPKFGCKTYNISQDSSMLISEFQQKPTANLYDMCDAYRL